MKKATIVMGIVPALSISAIMAGCSTVTPIVSPSGAPGAYIECGHNSRDCYSRASTACPHGWKLLGQQYTKFRDAVDNRQRQDVTDAERDWYPTKPKLMLIECSSQSVIDTILN